MSVPPVLPPAGWYPSPDGDPQSLQYWDGRQWTVHRAPAAIPAYPQYAPAPMPVLAPSGLRRVAALFSECWTIVRRAWWPITGVGLLLWSLWGLLVAAVAAVLDLGAWSGLLTDMIEADSSYGGTTAAQSAEFEQRASDLAAQIGPGTWVAAGAILTLATVAVAAAHSAAVYRLGAEAAAGRPAGFPAAREGMREGTLRVIGYGLLLSLLALALGGAIVAAVVLTSGLPPLAATIGVLGFVGWIVVLYWFTGRLVPAFVQACTPGGRGALGWSWQATRGRFWAVLGRYVLWSLVVSFAINLATSVAGIPLSLVFFGALFAGSATGWLVLMVIVISVVITAAASGFSYLGAVAIWRDLTTDENYRAIGEDGSIRQP